MTLTFTLKRLRPRNPLVAPALSRQAGSHRPSNRTLRQAGQNALRQELRHRADWRSP